MILIFLVFLDIIRILVIFRKIVLLGKVFGSWLGEVRDLFGFSLGFLI